MFKGLPLRLKTAWVLTSLDLVIDPLADIDLQPVWEILSNKNILKVFHAGRQDIEIFFNLTGKIPTPIYDTQIAAMFCGLGDQVSYDGLVNKFLGLTISKEQLKYAENRIKDAGLSDMVNFKLQDYRDERGKYDGIASIEMFEAVGEKYWPAYFDCVKNCLYPGKQATLQIITIQEARWEIYRRGVDFIQKYIFPGGMLPSPAVLRSEVERAGLKVVNSIEFGESYSQTLRRWHETFNEKWDQISEMGFDDRFRRMWNFYLPSCASTFHYGNCDVTQITIEKPS